MVAVPSIVENDDEDVSRKSSEKGIPLARPIRNSNASRPAITPSQMETVRKYLKDNPSCLVTENSRPFYLSAEEQSDCVAVQFSERIIFVYDTEKAFQKTVQNASARLKLDRRPKNELSGKVSFIRECYEYRDTTNESARTNSIALPNADNQKAFLKLLELAAKEGASDLDITIQPDAKYGVIRMCVDGQWETVGEHAAVDASKMQASAFSMMMQGTSAYFNPTEPSHGRLIRSANAKIPASLSAVRIQFNPLGSGGGNMVARLLPKDSGAAKDISELGYEPFQIEQIVEMRRRPGGAYLMSGPTGSGKSTTLKLNIEAYLREESFTKKAITIEDPPEYNIVGADQFAVLSGTSDEQRIEGFREALNGALRSAPNLIMIGEARDSASARAMIRAAVDGHALWSSIHSNSAMSILTGLLQRGVEEFYVFDAEIIGGLIGQRLVRRLCDHCKVPVSAALQMKEPSQRMSIRPETLKSITQIAEKSGVPLSSIFIENEHGCEHCKGRGVVGRKAVAEVIIPDQTFLDLYRNERRKEAHSHWLKELRGMTILEHAVGDVLRGRVDPRDVETRCDLLSRLDLSRLETVLEKVQ